MFWTVVCLVCVTPAIGTSRDITGEADKKTRQVLDVTFYGLDHEVSTGTAPTSSTPVGALSLLTAPWHAGRAGRHGGNHGYHGRGRGSYHGGGWRRGYHHGMGTINHGGRYHGLQQGGGPWWMQTNSSDQMTYVCERLRSSWPGNCRRLEWMLQTQRVSAQTLDEMRAVWNRRRDDMIACCAMETTDAKLQCVRDFQTRRFDRVCRGEEPICPWTLLQGQTGQQHTHTRCCQLHGSERVECFAQAMNNYNCPGSRYRRFRGRNL